MTIIRDQKLISEATNEDLLESYNALMGEGVKRFSSRAVAERRVAMAILSAADRTNHAGVPKDTNVPPKTMAELGQTAPEPELCPVCKAMTEELCKCGEKSAEPLPAARAVPVKREKFSAVQCTNTGETKIQPTSGRAAVLAWIKLQPKEQATLAEISRAFELPTRGHVQKLLATKHLAVVVA